MSVGRNPRYANGWRRSQLRKRVLAHYDTCHLCGEPVDKSLHYLDDGAPEVDELTPISRGGDPLNWHNVALSHRRCNRLKGDGTKPATLNEVPPKPSTSRHW